MLTLATRIGLHEFVAGAGLLELRGQPGQLRQRLVDQPDLGGQVVLVQVQRQVAADEAYFVSMYSNGQGNGQRAYLGRR